MAGTVLRQTAMSEPNQPIASRPYMPGYGTKPADEGTGLLPWSWAEQQLAAARNFWVASISPGGQPHLSPVWAVWDGESLLFSCAVQSRKARNLSERPRCTISVEDAYNPVVIEGDAILVEDMDARRALLVAMNRTYESHIEEYFLAPDRNAVFAIRPKRAFGLKHDDFEGSPTRWTFPAAQE
jgi:PPOX class probable F420-dependent enzyme